MTSSPAAPTADAITDLARRIEQRRQAEQRPDPAPEDQDAQKVSAASVLGVKPCEIATVVKTHRGTEITTKPGYSRPDSQVPARPIRYVLVDPEDPDGAGRYGLMILSGPVRPIQGTPWYTPRLDDHLREPGEDGGAA